MSIFGMEQHGMTERVTWRKEFEAWEVSFIFKKDGKPWVYTRLMEEHPRHMQETVKDFYRDDAVEAMKREMS